MIENRETAFMESCELERMAALLQSSGRYRILRRLEPRSAYHSPDGTRMHRAIFLDIETTGLDPACDEIIEMALVPFDFSSDGRIFSVHESFSRFRDPGRPIPSAVAAVTGITDDMVAGKSIDPAEIEAFLGHAVVVIAHNAGFDRRFPVSSIGLEIWTERPAIHPATKAGGTCSSACATAWRSRCASTNATAA
jgi:DNA polymerase III subunit epsilon